MRVGTVRNKRISIQRVAADSRSVRIRSKAGAGIKPGPRKVSALERVDMATEFALGMGLFACGVLVFLYLKLCEIAGKLDRKFGAGE